MPRAEPSAPATTHDDSIDHAPSLVVYSSLFPHPGRPGGGLFIRERLFRVAESLPLVVVSPQPWFPLQGLLRHFKPNYRPPAPRQLTQHTHSGKPVECYYPRFFSLPGLLRPLDGLFMALGSYTTLRRLRRQRHCDLIDAHFANPDGWAATRLGRRLGVPVTITLRGTEMPHSKDPKLRRRVMQALQAATRVFTVSGSLKALAEQLGAEPDKVQVIGNGVDLQRFHPLDRAEQRATLQLPDDALVLITVGALVPRKGFHRVIELLPALRQRFPTLHYLCIGGPSPEGDISAALQQQVTELGLQDCVHFLGSLPPEQLKGPLSAADLFVLSTSNEGWANVFLEAMACGLPVITTDVGGNAEVVCRPDLGKVVAFDDAAALRQALEEALAGVEQGQWDRQAILDYAAANSWDSRIGVLLAQLVRLVPNR